jgi:hypothetical protein
VNLSKHLLRFHTAKFNLRLAISTIAVIAVGLMAVYPAYAGEHCKTGGGDPDPEYNPDYCGCTWGFVISAGAYVTNAQVAMTYNGRTLTKTTQFDEASGEQEPIYGMRGHSISATLGSIVHFTVTFDTYILTRTVRLFPENLYEINKREQPLPFVRPSDNPPIADPPVVVSVMVSPSVVTQTTAGPVIRFAAIATNGQESIYKILGYEWLSSIDGELGSTAQFEAPAHLLSPGVHMIYVRAQDNVGRWSPYITTTLQIDTPPPTPTATPTADPTLTATSTAVATQTATPMPATATSLPTSTPTDVLSATSTATTAPSATPTPNTTTPVVTDIPLRQKVFLPVIMR